MSFTVDFHIHTIYSYDSLNRPKTIIKKARQKSLDAVVVLDHNTIKGGVQTAALNEGEVLVIPAVEIKTDIGDIIGLFIRKEIEATEYHTVIDQIHKQGGLVMLPHPYHKHDLKDDIYELLDLIEINNARTTAKNNQLAEELAKQYNVAGVSGSDAHFPWEIGRCVTIFDETPSTREELVNIILKGKRTHRNQLTGKINIVISQLIKYLRKPTSILRRLGLK